MSDLLKGMFRKLAYKSGYPRPRARGRSRSRTRTGMDLSRKRSNSTPSSPENEMSNGTTPNKLVLPPEPPKSPKGGTGIFAIRDVPLEAPSIHGHHRPRHSISEDSLNDLRHQESNFFIWLATAAVAALLILFFAFGYMAKESKYSDQRYLNGPLPPSVCSRSHEVPLDDEKRQLATFDTNALVSYKDLMIRHDSEPEIPFDFSLLTLGAKVLTTRNTVPFSTHDANLFGIPVWPDIYTDSQPEAPLEPLIIPGRCWRFKSFPGRLVIQLAESIVVTSFSISHILGSSVPHHGLRSASRNFEVWGLQGLDDQNPHLLGNYSFILSGPSNQQFPVENVVSVSFPIVELVVLSNYGATYTCIYRFKVFGSPQDDLLDILDMS